MAVESEDLNFLFFENIEELRKFIFSSITGYIGNLYAMNFYLKNDIERNFLVTYTLSFPEVKKISVKFPNFLKGNKKILQSISKNIPSGEGILVPKKDLIDFVKTKSELIYNKIVTKLTKKNIIDFYYFDKTEKIQWKFVDDVAKKIIKNKKQ